MTNAVRRLDLKVNIEFIESHVDYLFLVMEFRRVILYKLLATFGITLEW